MKLWKDIRKVLMNKVKLKVFKPKSVNLPKGTKFTLTKVYACTARNCGLHKRSYGVLVTIPRFG